MIHGDFGYSITSGQPVLDMITQRIPATAILMGTAWILWVVIATLAGVLAAVKRYSLIDQTITIFSYIFYSLPTFWLGLILIFIFAVELRWFPAQGIINVRTSPAPFATDAYWQRSSPTPGRSCTTSATHLVLPVATLIAVSVAGDSRFVRSAMLDSLSQDYVRTARAKGLPGAHGRLPARVPERTAADRDEHRPRDRLPVRRRDRHRDDLQLAGHGPAVLRRGQRAATTSC